MDVDVDVEGAVFVVGGFTRRRGSVAVAVGIGVGMGAGVGAGVSVGDVGRVRGCGEDKKHVAIGQCRE